METGALVIFENYDTPHYDAFADFGVFLRHGELKNFVSAPTLKKLEVVEWEEFDGEDVDLSAPMLDTRNITLQFNISDVAMFDSFIAMFYGNTAYRYIQVLALHTVYRLRLLSNPRYTFVDALGNFSLTFTDDFPPYVGSYSQCLPDNPNYILKADSYPSLASMGLPPQGYLIDDIDMGRYGARVISGTYSDMVKRPDIRKNLIVNPTKSHEIIYSNKEVHHKSKDGILKLLFTATNIDLFWQNWNRLLADLISPFERVLEIQEANIAGVKGDATRKYYFYYKKLEATELLISHSGSVWCKANLTVRILRELKQ